MVMLSVVKHLEMDQVVMLSAAKHLRINLARFFAPQKALGLRMTMQW